MESLFLRDAQAVGHCNCLGSKLTPFFRIVKVMAAIFRARVRWAIVGPYPFGDKSDIEVVQRTRTCAGRDGSTLEQILQISIVVVIQAAYRHALPVALQFAAHGAVLATVVGLDRETAVSPMPEKAKMVVTKEPAQRPPR
jgi:hypothetical protein